MIYVYLLINILLGAQAKGLVDWEHKANHEIISAKHEVQLKASMKLIRQAQRWDAQCFFELNEQKTPMSCFRFIKVLAENNWLTDKQYAEAFNFVDRRCLQALALVRVGEAVSLPSNSQCYVAQNKLHTVWEYKMEERQSYKLLQKKLGLK